MTIVVSLAALAVAVGMAWVFRSTPPRRLTPDALAGARGVLAGWNVLLVSVDTLRADHLGCYGHRRVETPVIDALATGGVRFAQAVAPVPLTLPSHSTMLTGLNPVRHGVRNNGTFKLQDDVLTLAEALAGAGYRTGAVVSAFVLDSRFGLAQGFQDYDDDLIEGDQPARGGFRERRAEVTNRSATEWLRQQGDAPWFLFVHYFDPHWPYAPPPPYRDRYKGAAYDGEIAYVDEQLGRLLSVLDETGARSRTLIVLTADHGESLGEHGENSHGIFIYDATQHVPLIVSGPPPLPARHVVERQVGVVDVMPTVLALLGVDTPPGLDGVNAFAPQTEARTIYVESLGSKLMHGCAPLFGVRRRDVKFILAPRPELYDLKDDPHELKNLYDPSDDRARQLRAALMAFVNDDVKGAASDEGNLALSEEAAERLRDLGYLVSSSRPTTTKTASRPTETDLPDPKDMIVHLRRSQRGQQLIMRGRFDQGFRLLEEHARQCPGDVMSLLRLAEGYRTAGRLDEAKRTYQKAIDQSPDDVTAIEGLGSVLLKLGEIDRAAEAFQRALKLDPTSTGALLGLGGVQFAQKRYEQALATFQRVAKLSSGSKAATAYGNIGAVYKELGRLDEARQALTKALAIDRYHLHAAKLLAQLDDRPDPQSIERLERSLQRAADPEGYLALGRMLHAAGQVDRAETALRRALSQRPDHVETQYELGRVLVAKTKGDDAETLFRRCIASDAKHAGARSQLGMLLARRGRFDEAARWLSEVVALTPADARAHYNLGIVLEQQRQTDRALAAFTRAVELDPSNANAHYHLGAVLAASGQTDLAAQHLRKALTLRPDYPQAKAALERLTSPAK